MKNKIEEKIKTIIKDSDEENDADYEDNVGDAECFTIGADIDKERNDLKTIITKITLKWLFTSIANVYYVSSFDVYSSYFY